MVVDATQTGLASPKFVESEFDDRKQQVDVRQFPRSFCGDYLLVAVEEDVVIDPKHLPLCQCK